MIDPGKLDSETCAHDVPEWRMRITHVSSPTTLQLIVRWRTHEPLQFNRNNWELIEYLTLWFFKHGKSPQLRAKIVITVNAHRNHLPFARICSCMCKSSPYLISYENLMNTSSGYTSANADVEYRLCCPVRMWFEGLPSSGPCWTRYAPHLWWSGIPKKQKIFCENISFYYFYRRLLICIVLLFTNHTWKLRILCDGHFSAISSIFWRYKNAFHESHSYYRWHQAVA